VLEGVKHLDVVALDWVRKTTTITTTKQNKMRFLP
jgi:hypothetical protein